MQTEHRRLEEQIKSLQSQLKQFPDGKLICARNDDHYKWYHSDGKVRTYIPKENRHLAEQLAAKKYLTLQLNETIQEKCAIEFYLRHAKTDQNIQKLTEHPEYQKLLSSFFKPLSQELTEWVQAPFERPLKYLEQLTQKSISGHMVRSKSEALIDTVLYINKIPFRYECALKLDETTIYPDFTIRHPRTGKLYYWEHFGRMDDPNYRRKVFAKQQLYADHNIIPSIQLISTYETREQPLNMEFVENLIHYYFL